MKLLWNIFIKSLSIKVTCANTIKRNIGIYIYFKETFLVAYGSNPLTLLAKEIPLKMFASPFMFEKKNKRNKEKLESLIIN